MGARHALTGRLPVSPARTSPWRRAYDTFHDTDCAPRGSPAAQGLSFLTGRPMRSAILAQAVKSLPWFAEMPNWHLLAAGRCASKRRNSTNAGRALRTASIDNGIRRQPAGKPAHRERPALGWCNRTKRRRERRWTVRCPPSVP
jgi:hypothetical protein